MASRKPLVVAIKASVDGAIGSMKKLAGSINGVSDAASATESAVSSTGNSVKKTARTASQVLTSLSTNSEALADKQIEALRKTQDELKKLKASGAITTRDYANGFQNAETKIRRINASIGRDTSTTAEKISKSLNRIGSKMIGIGKKASVAAGAAVASGAAAGGAAVSGINERAQTLQIGAQVAGLDQNDADLVRFQRFAAAIRDVGFDSEKAGDILKDMNDRLGDIKLTGAGPLVDFMETVAVDLGLVSKNIIGDDKKIKAAAKKLFTGKDSLDVLETLVDKVIKSGGGIEELSFLLEGLAGDATRLVPLLAGGSAELNRLGQAAEDSGSFMTLDDLKKIRAFRESARGVGDAIKAIGVDMVRAGILETLSGFLDRIKEVIEWVRENASPEMLKWGGIIAGLVAVIGPIILALGALFLVIGPIAGVLATAAVEFGVIIAAVIGLGTALYKTAGYIREAWNWITDSVPDWIKGKSPTQTMKAIGPTSSEKVFSGSPVNIRIGDQMFSDIGRDQDAAKALANHVNKKSSARPTSIPRPFR